MMIFGRTKGGSMNARRPKAARIAASHLAGILSIGASSRISRSAFRLGFSTARAGRRRTPIELIVRNDAGNPARALHTPRGVGELGLGAPP